MANVIRVYNQKMDRLNLNDQSTITSISKHLTHWHKYRKYPQDLIDALISKFTKILEKNWYGDEPEQTVINQYLYWKGEPEYDHDKPRA